MRKFVWITLVAAILLILAACGSQAPPEPLELTIDMTEYAFEPADLEFQVGQEVTLHLTNSGALEHEIMFGRDVMMTDGRPSGYMVDMFETAGVEPEVTVEAAEEELEKQLVEFPDSARIHALHMNFAYAYRRMDDHAAAFKHMEQLVKYYKKLSFDPHTSDKNVLQKGYEEYGVPMITKVSDLQKSCT